MIRTAKISRKRSNKHKTLKRGGVVVLQRFYTQDHLNHEALAL